MYYICKSIEEALKVIPTTLKGLGLKASITVLCIYVFVFVWFGLFIYFVFFSFFLISHI